MSLLKVYKTSCKNCLLSKDRIVSPKRAKQIIKESTEDDSYFICHKSSMNGGEVCCNRYYHEIGDKSGKIEILNQLNEVANGQIIEFVEQENNEKYTPYLELNNP